MMARNCARCRNTGARRQRRHVRHGDELVDRLKQPLAPIVALQEVHERLKRIDHRRVHCARVIPLDEQQARRVERRDVERCLLKHAAGLVRQRAGAVWAMDAPRRSPQSFRKYKILLSSRVPSVRVSSHCHFCLPARCAFVPCCCCCCSRVARVTRGSRHRRILHCSSARLPREH